MEQKVLTTEINNMALPGQLTKYKPEYDEEIIRLASETIKNHMYRIAVKWEVHVDTLHEWRKVHPSFSEAYTRARNIQNSFLIDLVIDSVSDRNANAQALNMLMLQLGNMSKDRQLRLDVSGNTLAEKANSIMNELRNGKMTATEFSSVMSGISTAAKIDEVTDLRDKLEKLESEE